MSLVRESMLVAGKDLRIEARSRVVTSQVLPFAGIVLFLFAFALDPDRGVLRRVAPGLFWVAVLLAALLAIGRAFAVESQHGARDALRLSGLDGASVFCGKAAAVALQLAVLEVLLGAGVVVLYDVDLAGVAVVFPAALAATVALAALGTLYGVLAAGLRVRETLLPLLLLPALTPVMIGATRAFEAGLDGRLADGWPWVGLLATFAALSVALGILFFGPLLEET